MAFGIVHFRECSLNSDPSFGLIVHYGSFQNQLNNLELDSLA